MLVASPPPRPDTSHPSSGVPNGSWLQYHIKKITVFFNLSFGRGKLIRIHFGATGKLASVAIETCESKHSIWHLGLGHRGISWGP